MKKTATGLRLAASDVANHLACRHLTELNRDAAEGRLEWPHFDDSGLDALRERGMEHERQYLEALRKDGLEVVEISSEQSDAGKTEATTTEMRRGVAVIAQGALGSGRWFGLADVLRRVDRPSKLGAFSYEPYDTKLARETKGSAVLQLCLYSDLLEQAQGVLPEYLHVVPPGVNFVPQRFRVRDLFAYYRWVKGQLEVEVDQPAGDLRHYPEPIDLCEVCRWDKACDQQRRKDDHLSLVASITRLQRRELVEHHVERLDALAKVPLPIPWKPERGSIESLTRSREQARIQLESREAKRPLYETLDLEPDRGFFLLPEPSPGDIFFDIEGDPFAGPSGLEYLFGYVSREGKGGPEYEALWAFDRVAEKAMFESFVDGVLETWERHPGMHIYHYAPYEPSALKRLMGRYGTREDAVDRMLRGGLFVDLFRIVRQSLRAGVESYSIKKLEPLFRFDRQVPLREAGDARHELEQLLELNGLPDVPDAMRETVRGYNEDDCLSAMQLRDWLEGLRRELVASGSEIPRPPARSPDASEELQEENAAVQAVYDRLVAKVSVDPTERSEGDQGQWLLAQLLSFYRREGKSDAWECRRLAELTDEELLGERAAVAGLEWVETVQPAAGRRLPIERYRFPPQDCDLHAETPLLIPDGEWGLNIGTLVAFDPNQGTLDIKKSVATAHPTAVYGFTKYLTPEQQGALLRLGEWVADHGIDAPGLHRAARDLLIRSPPRLSNPSPLQAKGETTLAAACRLALDLDTGVLPIQGPPGAGKTFTGAHLVCALVRAGRKVGITATSHKVINLLLQKVAEVAATQKLPLRCGHKDSEAVDGIEQLGTNEDALDALTKGQIQVLGATAWLWAREEAMGAVDVLVVDEAGQFSLANALAVAQAADGLILLGDPRQLEQPIKGSHPDGAAISALEHLLGDHLTVPPDRGLFLGETYRLHPAICALTSELFYDDRLHPIQGRDRQRLEGTDGFDGAGLWQIAVEHQGNQTSSPEEVDAIEALVPKLLAKGASWVDHDGKKKPLGPADVLIVAPYNAQVNLLSRRLPGMRIGTVDKFQGQEAPIVIISMSSSSAEEAPRGMEFLYSANRFNVATSRAKCACILLSSPKLLEPECRSPRQMRLANAFCRYRELASSPTAKAVPQTKPAQARSGFDLLHPAVQRRLWEMKWETLRPIQDLAIEHLMARRGDCVISAPTSGGKTEAAFLPILSLIADNSGPGARVLYIGPLKALINDQFRRIEDLCKRMEMPVHKWHGDVDDAARRAFLNQPSGVVLITPESLEAMFVLRPTKMAALFQGLAFVVVDELHALIGSVRGAQLQSQLFRLQRRCNVNPVRVGLSATIGDPAAACRWLRHNGPPATFLKDDTDRRIAVRVKGYWDRAPGTELPDDSPDAVPRQLAREILRSCHAETNLVFANAKSQIEEVADAMKLEAEAMGIRHEVVVHHGSLSKEQREYAEERLRRDTPCSAVCSNTLELGIDIGEIDNVVQISAPWSVSSLAQRLGRSGRRANGTAILRELLVEQALDDHSSIWDGLHVELLRGIAMIELMLKHYVEPPDVHRAQLSTLVHQLLSTLAETGGCGAKQLFDQLMGCGAFGPLSPADFASLLRALGATELIQQMEGGDLVLGPKGQKLCDHYSFYAAFVSPEEFRVLCGSDPIGTLPASMIPLAGENFILAGRRWQVREIDAERREILVVPGKGRRKPHFGSLLAGVDPQIQKAMLELVTGESIPRYIDETAKDILAEARASALRLNHFRPLAQELQESRRTQLFLWAGSRVQRTIYLVLREGDLSVEDHEVGIEVLAPLADVCRTLEEFARQPGDGLRLAERAEVECGARAAGEKYDWTLPDLLWRRAFVADSLDLAGAALTAQAILRSLAHAS